MIKKCLTFLAKTSARALPYPQIWEKEKLWKELVEDQMSLIMWPNVFFLIV